MNHSIPYLIGGFLFLALILLAAGTIGHIFTSWFQCDRCHVYFNDRYETQDEPPYRVNVHPGRCEKCQKI